MIKKAKSPHFKEDIDTIKNRKFLEAIDLIIDASSMNGGTSFNDTNLSLLVSTDKSIISSIRNQRRNASESMIIKLARIFNIDINFFYREGGQFHYNPPTINRQHLLIEKYKLLPVNRESFKEVRQIERELFCILEKLQSLGHKDLVEVAGNIKKLSNKLLEKIKSFN